MRLFQIQLTRENFENIKFYENIPKVLDYVFSFLLYLRFRFWGNNLVIKLANEN